MNRTVIPRGSIFSTIITLFSRIQNAVAANTIDFARRRTAVPVLFVAVITLFSRVHFAVPAQIHFFYKTAGGTAVPADIVVVIALFTLIQNAIPAVFGNKFEVRNVA